MEPDIQVEAINIIENRISNIINRFQKPFISEKIKSFKDELTRQLKATDCSQITTYKDPGQKEDIEKVDEESENRTKYDHIMLAVERLSSQLGMDPELIKTMIEVESNFNPDAVSSCGAMGLMQLMPATADHLGVQDPFDIYENLKGGITYIKSLMESFSGDIKLALAAYNAGSAKVEEFGGIPPIEETQNYVYKILASYNPSLL